MHTPPNADFSVPEAQCRFSKDGFRNTPASLHGHTPRYSTGMLSAAGTAPYAFLNVELQFKHDVTSLSRFYNYGSVSAAPMVNGI